MATKKSRKKPSPAPKRLRAKGGLGRLSRNKKLELGDHYVASQASSPLGDQVAAQVANVKLKHDILAAKDKEHRDAVAAAAQKDAEVRVAESEYLMALEVYAHDATVAANSDAAALATLGVVASAPRASAGGAPELPAAPVVAPGPSSGSLKVGFKKPNGASSMLVHYRFDGAAPDAWSEPAGTTRSSVVFDKLSPGALVRVRIRAIGNGMSDWSEEGLGRVG